MNTYEQGWVISHQIRTLNYVCNVVFSALDTLKIYLLTDSTRLKERTEWMNTLLPGVSFVGILKSQSQFG